MKKQPALFCCSAVAFLAALMVHILSYFLILHGAQFAIWPAALFLFALVVHRFRQLCRLPQRLFFAEKWMIALVVVCALYAAVNFMGICVMLSAGSGELVDGQYCLVQKGMVKGEISYAEYRRLVFAEQRLFSGHILPFLAVSLGVFAEPETGESKT